MGYRALTPNSSRPQTPPSVPSFGSSRNNNTPPPNKGNSAVSKLSSRSTYADLVYGRNRKWTTGEADDDGEMEDHLDFDLNVDEDEFGLPSIATSRRRTRRAGVPSLVSAEGEKNPTSANGMLLGTELSAGRVRANSSDIAEERGTPNYPTAKKPEGKILRPQYKDILRGVHHISDF